MAKEFSFEDYLASVVKNMPANAFESDTAIRQMLELFKAIVIADAALYAKLAPFYEYIKANPRRFADSISKVLILKKQYPADSVEYLKVRNQIFRHAFIDEKNQQLFLTFLSILDNEEKDARDNLARQIEVIASGSVLCNALLNELKLNIKNTLQSPADYISVQMRSHEYFFRTQFEKKIWPIWLGITLGLFIIGLLVFATLGGGGLFIFICVAFFACLMIYVILDTQFNTHRHSFVGKFLQTYPMRKAQVWHKIMAEKILAAPDMTRLFELGNRIYAQQAEWNKEIDPAIVQFCHRKGHAATETNGDDDPDQLLSTRIEQLADFKDTTDIPFFTECLSHKNSTVRRQSLAALVRIGHYSVISVLQKFQSDPDLNFRQSVHEGLARLKTLPPPPPPCPTLDPESWKNWIAETKNCVIPLISIRMIKSREQGSDVLKILDKSKIDIAMDTALRNYQTMQPLLKQWIAKIPDKAAMSSAISKEQKAFEQACESVIADLLKKSTAMAAERKHQEEVARNLREVAAEREQLQTAASITAVASSIIAIKSISDWMDKKS
jgi:hypothetical protein